MVHRFSLSSSRLLFRKVAFSLSIHLSSTRDHMDKLCDSITFWRNTFRLHNKNSTSSSKSWLNTWLYTGFQYRAPSPVQLLHGRQPQVALKFPNIITPQFLWVSNFVPKSFPVNKQWSSMWTIVEKLNLPKFESTRQLRFVSQKNIQSIGVSTKSWNKLVPLFFA